MSKKMAVIFRPLVGFWNIIGTNPIILKELRGRMRGWRGTFNLAFYSAALSFFGILLYLGFYTSQNTYNYYTNYYKTTNPNSNVVIKPVSMTYSSYSADAGNQLLLALIIGQLILIIFLSPAFSAGTIASEKERQTYDILLLTLLKPRDIVLGKLFSTQAYLCLMIVAALPVLSVVFLVGGVSLSQILIGLAVCLFTTLLLGAMSIFWSAVSRTTGRAFRNAFWVMLVFFLGIPGMGILMDQLVRKFDMYQISGLYAYEPPGWLQAFEHFAYSFNPVVALVLSYVVLSNTTTDLFFYNYSYFDSNGQKATGIYLPMPWLTFLCIAVLLCILFIWWATRLVKPVNYGAKEFKNAKHKKTKQ